MLEAVCWLNKGFCCCSKLRLGLLLSLMDVLVNGDDTIQRELPCQAPEDPLGPQRLGRP